jgi:hypothetical protein
MDQKIYHGSIRPADFSHSLIGQFNHGNLRAQQIGDENRLVVQIATSSVHASGGQTALTVILQKVADGVSIQVGQQDWLGVAASLGISALSVFHNPFNLMGRLDDIAQDIENLQLTDAVWRVLNETAQVMEASTELSRRLRRITCLYCGVANPIGEPSCIACGAPLGAVQPRTCTKCGYVVKNAEQNCPNCRAPLPIIAISNHRD